MNGMLETLALPTTVINSDFKLVATAVREYPTDPWYLFCSAPGSDLWVLMAEQADLPDDSSISISHGLAVSYAKLAVLIGCEWGDIWDDLSGQLAYQMRALDNLGPAMKARLDTSSIEGIFRMRNELEARPITGPELTRQSLTGIDPLAGRN